MYLKAVAVRVRVKGNWRSHLVEMLFSTTNCMSNCNNRQKNKDEISKAFNICTDQLFSEVPRDKCGSRTKGSRTFDMRGGLRATGGGPQGR